MDELRSCVINGANMITREEAHRELANALSLPTYYGANLDALWDVASTMKVSATMLHTADMLNVLGVYGAKILKTLYEAAQENPEFKFHAE